MNLFDQARLLEEGENLQTTSVKSEMLGELPWLDLDEWHKSNPLEPIPPDPSIFGKEALSKLPNMGWLEHVSVELVYPTGKSLAEQREELRRFKVRLYAELNRISRELCPAKLPEGFNEPVLALDTETTGLDVRVRYINGKLVTRTLLVGLCLASSGDKGYYLPVRNTEEDGIPNWNHHAIVEFTNELHEECVIIYSNSAYDREALTLNGCTLKRTFPYFFDDQILDFLTDVNTSRHGLKIVSEKRLGRKMVEIQELLYGIGTKKSKSSYIRFDRLPAINAVVYGGSDALNTYALFQLFATTSVNNVFHNQPIPLELDHKFVDVLRRICRTGMPVNFRYFYYAAMDAIQRWKSTEEFIYKLLGRKIDLGSSQQLSNLLFNELQIPLLFNHKRGEHADGTMGYPSTDEDTLDELYKLHPDIIQLKFIVQWRKLNNAVVKMFNNCLVNSYVDEVLPYTKVQLSFSQTTADTGRLSSSSNDGAERLSLKIAPKSSKRTWVYHSGSWDAGFNSQGISSAQHIPKKCKKIKKLPDEAGIDLSNLYPSETRESLYIGLAKKK